MYDGKPLSRAELDCKAKKTALALSFYDGDGSTIFKGERRDPSQGLSGRRSRRF